MRICQHDICCMPVFGTDKSTGKGYCKNHQWCRTDLDKRSIVQKAVDKARLGVREIGIQCADELNAWFLLKDFEAKGVCDNCGGKTCKGDKKYYKYSIAHLLPKAYFPSVATHPDNWLELCFFGNSCHTQMDNKMLDLIDMNCWDLIVTKFQKIYPFIAKNEKKRIPDILLQYVGSDF